MTIREQTERLEEELLSPRAMRSKNTRGRVRPEKPCPIRTDFQRDRDRILHCNAFRRLMHKTQVYLSPEGDHYRTRLTHTLEVTQIAKTIARALRVNEDLTEAAALGHDLGHTPFGHAGEYVLDEICPHGYVHSRQSVRVVDKLEKMGKGLNLTWEVKNGIACHSSGTPASTLEGQIVRYADKIAYMNHDIEDSIRAGIMTENDLPYDLLYLLGRSKSERITTFVRSIIENSTDRIAMSPEIDAAYYRLRDFMFETVYTNPVAKGEESKAKDVVRKLYSYYIENLDKLPAEYRQIAEEEDGDRAVCDYISGMSDRFAINLFETLFIPKSWGV